MDKKERVAARIAKLKEKLKELELHAAMIYDHENLIYFAGIDDLEGGALVVPADGEPELFCLAFETAHIKSACGIERVTPYMFPQKNQSLVMGEWLKKQGWKAPRIGFTRYFISLKDFQCLRDAAPDMFVGDIAIPCYEIRSIKDEEEIETMRTAAKVVSEGMRAAVDCVSAGMKETDVLAEAEYAMTKAGSMGSPFRMQVLTHSRQFNIHGYASDALIENDAPVVIHLGASYKGYTAKMCRTAFLGNPDPQSVNIYETLVEAQQVAVNAVRPGVTCGEVFQATADFVASKGYGEQFIVDHIGYGVGIRQSEFYPVIAKGSPVVLQENMVIDLLMPTIFVPRKGGPRITDTLLIKKDGVEFLTDYPAEAVYH
ncbi:MAG: aminopeptidase P family protein [Lachnospiraceae bacterium]|nr:aminopeptidase P family protein [Lachnospiraceae bacterium]